MRVKGDVSAPEYQPTLWRQAESAQGKGEGPRRIRQRRSAHGALTRGADWDPCHGLKMRYTNSRTGDGAMPTIATFLQLLPAGFETAP